MDRRQFLAAGTAALAAVHLPLDRLFAQAPNATVWECNRVTPEGVASLLEALGGLDALLGREAASATVLLKPNLCLPDDPARGTVTAPEVVQILCGVLARQGVRRIIVADHTLKATGEFARHPLLDLPSQCSQARLLLANEERMYEPVEVAGKVLDRVERMKILASADLVINLPVAKHHSATHVSLGVKNLMGTIWNRSDFHTRMDLAQAIGDLARVIRPALTVVDATRVLLGGGPTGPGPVVRDGRLYASTDIVAVDSVVASRYAFGGKNLEPSDIPHLQAAASGGAGEIDLSRISVRTV